MSYIQPAKTYCMFSYFAVGFETDCAGSSMSFEYPVVDASEKSLTRAQKKNMKKKQKKKESKPNDYAFEIEEVICTMEEVKISEESEKDVAGARKTTPDVVGKDHHPIEVTKKKLRTLKKKLKQIEELEERLRLGEISPNKEQLNKISKKEEFLEDIQTITATL